jgi:hypothetical protein
MGLVAFSYESVIGVLIWDFHSVVDDDCSLLDRTQCLLEICYHKDCDWKQFRNVGGKISINTTSYPKRLKRSRDYNFGFYKCEEFG